jgi:hypothetical protein
MLLSSYRRGRWMTKGMQDSNSFAFLLEVMQKKKKKNSLRFSFAMLHVESLEGNLA